MSSSGQSDRPTKEHDLQKEKNEKEIITFPKQIYGLFEEASEFCSETGAEVGIIVLSEDNETAYSFGNPDINTVTNRFLAQESDGLIPKENQAMECLFSTDNQKARKKKFNRAKKVDNKEKDIPNLGELNYEQLGDLKGKIMELSKKLKTKIMI
ncbi:Agamous-like MADS-box protein AGL62 [Striga hermonthica]|uniref:Agamous-like MADS-box protein AGL62 n=1 Tax=Striga hermonthica TaxID=68872 RepID=A0A9N7NWZ2_STRHE|nr:Agamous-like MADS-box protein AGL62 [Striga hermonthica]